MDAPAKLRAAVAQGYLLHGSPHTISVLTPRPARCAEKSEGNQTGVYATRNVLVALLAGLLRCKDPTRPRQTRWSGTSEHVEAWGRNVELGDGTVYVLKGDTFSVVHTDDGEETNEFVSPFPVEPVEAVTVTPHLLSSVDIALTLE